MTEQLDALIAAIEAGNWNGQGAAISASVVDRCRAVSAYHGSLDAAIALHAALLPGWWLQISGPTASGDWMVNFAGHDSAFAATPARAWLLATLKGYRATLTPAASAKPL